MTENQTAVDGLAPASPDPRRGQFGSLTGPECLELLDRNEVGRVSFVTTNGPHIYPVNYAMDEGTIIIRTSPYAGLFTSSSGLVAFEIDEIDVVRRQGWSVLVIGTAAEVDDPDEAIRLRRKGKPEPWAPGQRNVFVRITPREITGRRLS
jgi:uncharacterized protein